MCKRLHLQNIDPQEIQHHLHNTVPRPRQLLDADFNTICNLVTEMLHEPVISQVSPQRALREMPATINAHTCWDNRVRQDDDRTIWLSIYYSQEHLQNLHHWK